MSTYLVWNKSLITSPVVRARLYKLFIVGEKEMLENKTLLEVYLPSAVHAIFLVVLVSICYVRTE